MSDPVAAKGEGGGASAASHVAAPWSAILRLSSGLLGLERLAIMALMFLLTGLILVNVATRYSGVPVYWIDESAVYSVVWLTFVGASAMTRLRLDFAVSLLTERLSARGARIAKLVATLGGVGFGLALAWMCWLWMDPLGIAQAGFDAREFAGESFNFLYTERTQTLNWPTWILYLAVPLFAVSMTIHGLANLIEDLGLSPKVRLVGFPMANAEVVN